MSDLLDALADYDRNKGDSLLSRNLEVIVEAARMWLNPNIEAFHKALYEWYHSDRPMSSEIEEELIAAALTPGDTDE